MPFHYPDHWVPEDLTAETIDVSVARSIIQTNIVGMLQLTAALLPTLKQQPAAMIMTTTSPSQIGPTNWAQWVRFLRALRGRARLQSAPLQGAHTPSPGSTLTPLAPGAYSERVEFGSPWGTAHAALSFAPQIVALSVLALGCKTGKSFDRTTEPGGRPLSRTTTGSLIIKGRAFGTNNPRRLCRWDANL